MSGMLANTTRRLLWSRIGLVALGCAGAMLPGQASGILPGQSSDVVTVANETARHQLSEGYGKLPVSFEANRGQTDPEVKFLARGPNGRLFLTAAELVVVVTRSDAPARELAAPRKSVAEKPAKAAVLRMSFAGGHRTPRVTGLEELPGKANYFTGSDPSRWRTNVPTYAKVRYEEVYPGIDLVYYSTQRQLEYDFIVRAGADPDRIVLGFQGADRLELDAQGDLVLHTAAGVIRQRKPVIYQEFDGVKKEIPGAYVLKDRQHVAFRVEGYDASRPLVIDPVLIYSSYLGGTASDIGLGIALDGSGNAYVTGGTSSTDFPTTAGASQTAFGGGSDVFVTKVNSTGSALVYSTYLGGSVGENASGIAVDGSGNAYVTGWTRSANFPTTAGAFQTTLRGMLDAFVTKVNSTGSALAYSTYLGGTSAEDGGAIAVDGAGHAYVTGLTLSTNFPTSAGAFQTTRGGNTDAFVTKVNAAGSALVYSTYLGGRDDAENGFGIAVDGSGNAYVTGWTFSLGFPTTSGAFDRAFNGVSDVFVTKVNAMGSALVYSTYLGGASWDVGNGIAVDGSGNAYVTGTARSANFPTTAGAFRTTGHGDLMAFVTKVNATGSALAYSTYLGGGFQDDAFGIALDGSGDAFVTGSARSTDFPTTANAFQTTIRGGADAFVTRVNSTGSALVYSTYLGGTGGDHGNAIAVDGSGNVYVTGHMGSANFPTTPGAFQTTSPGGGDSFAVKMATQSPFYEIVHQRTSVPASGFAIVNVACSSGNKVLGGGFLIETPDFIKIFSAGPFNNLGFLSDTQWSVVAKNIDPAGSDSQVTAVAICASAQRVAGHEIVFTQRFLAAGPVATNVNVACSSGKKVLGGGFQIETPDFVKIFHSLPSTGLGALSDHQWDVSALSTMGTRQVTSVAICAFPTAVPGHEIVMNPSSVPAASPPTVPFGQATVACSSGKRVLGGGFHVETPDFVELFSSEPADGMSTFSDHQWNVSVQNTDPMNARQFTAVGICASL